MDEKEVDKYRALQVMKWKLNDLETNQKDLKKNVI